MGKRCYSAIASVLYLVCFAGVCGLLANAAEIIELSGTSNSIIAIISVISGYCATFFSCICSKTHKKSQKKMRFYFLVLSLFYLVLLLDFTLIDDTFGRNIFNILSWDRKAFGDYLETNTNIIPFATIKLFIKGYLNNKLSLLATIVNLLGNFAAFMPLPFFIRLFFGNKIGTFKMLLSVLFSVAVIEFLQLAFLTGSCDIDDVILNVSGAMVFYFVSISPLIGKGISKLTFGVWKTNE